MKKKLVVDTMIPEYQATWTADFELQLRDALSGTGLPHDAANAVVEAARRGLITDRADVLLPRINKLQSLHTLYPGFSLTATLLQSPHVLGHSTAHVVSAMRHFQDRFPHVDVGPAMEKLGRFILQDADRTVSMLNITHRLLKQHANIPLPLSSLHSGCEWLQVSMAGWRPGGDSLTHLHYTTQRQRQWR